MATKKKLNTQQTGRIGEVFAISEFVRYGYDVYSAEVDDKGIDLVVRDDRAGANPAYFDVQVKATGNLSSGYVFMRKDKFPLRDNMLVALVDLTDVDAPAMYVIPAQRWLETDAIFVDRDYEGKASEPEYGLNLSRKNLPILEPYLFKGKIPR